MAEAVKATLRLATLGPDGLCHLPFDPNYRVKAIDRNTLLRQSQHQPGYVTYTKSRTPPFSQTFIFRLEI